MMKNFWVKKILGIAVCVLLAVVVFGYIVMLLWNGILVTVLGVKAITFWQSVGILALSKILFGGFYKGGGGCRGKQWGMEMKEKWQNMNPEEREKFKEEMRNRCKSWRKTDDC